MWSVIALRLTCRHLNNTYLRCEDRIRTAIIYRLAAPFYDYFDFFVRLKFPDDAVSHPPPSGWPSLAVQNREDFGVADLFVIDVLRHLPYIRADHENVTDYKSYFLSYSEEIPESINGRFGDYRYSLVEPDNYWVMIAHGYESGGVMIFLNTLTAEVMEYIIRMDGGLGFEPVADYFAKKRTIFENLEAVFWPGGEFPLGGEDEPYDAVVMEAKGEPRGLEPGFGSCNEDYLWLRHLYRKFGWPDKCWRKKEALEAISDYVNRRDEDQ